ncbi:hypothetical protein [Blastococcus saxobsidens]|nr:hypothetical protein [Blastococcus saxobsidens]
MSSALATTLRESATTAPDEPLCRIGELVTELPEEPHRHDPREELR